MTFTDMCRAAPRDQWACGPDLPERERAFEGL
jgi:hypothetical protein